MIINILFWIILMVTMLGVGLLIYSIIRQEKIILLPAFLLLFYIGICGWGLMGVGIPLKTETIKITAKVLHDNHSVHLSYNDIIIKSFENVAIYEYLSDKSNVEVQGTYERNMYGSVINGTTNWTFPNK